MSDQGKKPEDIERGFIASLRVKPISQPLPSHGGRPKKIPDWSQAFWRAVAEVRASSVALKEGLKSTGGLGQKTKQLLGLTGSALLFLGVFMPIVSVPIVGGMNYFQNGKGDGTFILGFAVISVWLTLTRHYRALWITGLGAIALMTFTFINFQVRLSQAGRELERNLAGNPFRGLGELALQSVQLQWGWAVLVIGAALVIAAAAIKEPTESV